MFAKFANAFGKYALVVATMALTGNAAFAQENAEQADDEVEVIDEIIVTAGDKPGDPVDVDALYEDMMRDMLMIDLDRLNELDEQQEWRAATNKSVQTSSRITWGYDPHDELRIRREHDMSDVRGVTTKPATVFRFEF